MIDLSLVVINNFIIYTFVRYEYHTLNNYKYYLTNVITKIGISDNFHICIGNMVIFMYRLINYRCKYIYIYIFVREDVSYLLQVD